MKVLKNLKKLLKLKKLIINKLSCELQKFLEYYEVIIIKNS